MKRIEILRSWLMLALLIITGTAALAQESKPNIFDALKEERPGTGVIIIVQDPAIEALIGKKANPLDNARKVGGYAILQGYKIQAYSGNLPNSRSVASSRQEQVRSIYPEYEPIVEYDAPFWRLRIGNFVEREEAQEALQELMKAFPRFAREMYIVRSQIKVAVPQQ